MAAETTMSEQIDADPSRTATAVQACVDGIVTHLDNTGIPYCILHSRQLIPHGLRFSPDIDLLVPANVSPSRLVEVLADLSPTQIVNVRSNVVTFVFSVRKFFIRVHFHCGNINWRGATLMSADEILSNRWDDDGLMVASERHQALTPMMLSLVRGTRIGNVGAFPVDAAIRQHPATLRAVMHRTFSRRMADRIMAAHQADSLLEEQFSVKELRRSLWLRSLGRHPLKTAWGTARDMGCAARNWIHPSGLEVAILGADGVGKTSLCMGIVDLPRSMRPFENTEWTHLYQRVLPSLGQIACWVKRRPYAPDGKHGASPGRGPTRTPFWLLGYFYYSVDMWLSRLFKGRHQLAQASLVLHDRHPLEIGLDLTRYRYAGPKKIARWMVGFAPQPHLVIVLDAPDELIFERKPQTSRTESQRRLNLYRDYSARHLDVRLVDASRSPEDVLEDVLAIVQEHIGERTRQRFGQSGTVPGESPDSPTRINMQLPGVPQLDASDSTIAG